MQTNKYFLLYHERQYVILYMSIYIRISLNYISLLNFNNTILDSK